jgi:hypothetical protein
MEIEKSYITDESGTIKNVVTLTHLEKLRAYFWIKGLQRPWMKYKMMLNMILKKQRYY